MKNIIALILILSSINVFAGAEEHEQSQICYSLQSPDVATASVYVPRKICLETVNIDAMKNQISVFSFFMPELYEDLKLTSLIRRNEDVYSFKAISKLADQAQVATDESVIVDLMISGETDFNGAGDISNLKIQVKERRDKYADDTITQINVFDYVKN
jgi:hypothetical protein